MTIALQVIILHHDILYVYLLINTCIPLYKRNDIFNFFVDVDIVVKLHFLFAYYMTKKRDFAIPYQRVDLRT